MPARFKRKQSKRMTCRRKYKIIKKVAEHRRKLRREQKKNPKSYKSKDPGIPRSLPFYDEILQEVERCKQRAEAIKEKQRAKRLELQTQNREVSEVDMTIAHAEEEESEFQKVQEMCITKKVEVAASSPTNCASLNQKEEMDTGMEVKGEVKKKNKSKKGKTRN